MLNQTDFEKTLHCGAQVEIRWSSKGVDYSAPATVITLRKTTVEVTLDAAVKEFPAGHKVSVPLLTKSSRWTPRACVRPLG